MPAPCLDRGPAGSGQQVRGRNRLVRATHPGRELIAWGSDPRPPLMTGVGRPGTSPNDQNPRPTSRSRPATTPKPRPTHETSWTESGVARPHAGPQQMRQAKRRSPPALERPTRNMRVEPQWPRWPCRRGYHESEPAFGESILRSPIPGADSDIPWRATKDRISNSRSTGPPIDRAPVQDSAPGPAASCAPQREAST